MKSCAFGAMWGWLNDDTIVIFGWTLPLIYSRGQRQGQQRAPRLPNSCVKTRQDILEEKTHWSDKETDSLSLNRSIAGEKMHLCLEKGNANAFITERQRHIWDIITEYFALFGLSLKQMKCCSNKHTTQNYSVQMYRVYSTSKQRLMLSSTKNDDLQSKK